MPVNAIFFDLGELLMKVHREPVKEKFRLLGSTHVDNMFEDEEVKEWYKQLEQGIIPTSEFRTLLKRKLGIPTITDAQFDIAWNSMLGEIPAERLDFIEALKAQGYKIFLLSNSSEIHHAEIQRLHGARFAELFDKQYYSHQLRMAKPNRDIFDYVLNDNHLMPRQSLLADDRGENIASASNVGMHVAHTTVHQSVHVIQYAIHRAERIERYRSSRERVRQYREQQTPSMINTVMGAGLLLASAGLFLYNFTNRNETEADTSLKPALNPSLIIK